MDVYETVVFLLPISTLLWGSLMIPKKANEDLQNKKIVQRLSETKVAESESLLSLCPPFCFQDHSELAGWSKRKCLKANCGEASTKGFPFLQSCAPVFFKTWELKSFQIRQSLVCSAVFKLGSLRIASLELWGTRILSVTVLRMPLCIHIL